MASAEQNQWFGVSVCASYESVIFEKEANVLYLRARLAFDDSYAFFLFFLLPILHSSRSLSLHPDTD